MNDHTIDSSKLELDSDDPGPDGEWSCPRGTKGEMDYCLFHTPPDDRRRTGNEVSQIILDTFNESDSHKQDDGVTSWRNWDVVDERQTVGARYRRERKQFIGAKLSDVTLKLAYADCNGGDHYHYPIDLRGASVQSIELWKSNVVGGLRLHGAILTGGEGQDYGDLSANDSKIDGAIEAPHIMVRDFTADNADISGNVTFDHSEITGSVSFNEANVSGKFDFTGTTVNSEINLSETTIQGKVSLNDTTASFIYCDSASIESFEIENNSEIMGRARLRNAEFNDTLNIDSSAFVHPIINSIDLSGSIIASGKWNAHDDPPKRDTGTPPVSNIPFIFDVSDGKIEDVKVAQDCDCESATAFEHAYIFETDLTDFPFKTESNRSSLRASSWNLHSLIPGGHTILNMYDKALIGEETGDALDEMVKMSKDIIVEIDSDENLRELILEAKWKEVLDECTSPDPRLEYFIKQEARYRKLRTINDCLLFLRSEVSNFVTKYVKSPQEESTVYPRNLNTSQSEVYLRDQDALLQTIRHISEDIVSVREEGDQPTESDFQRWRKSLATVIAHRFARKQNTVAKPEQLESTYLSAKNGAVHEGDQTAAGEFFQKEKIWARRQYLNSISSTTTKDIYRYVSNILFSVVAGYGERPQRVLRWSLGVIVIFGLCYWGIGNYLLGDESNMTMLEAGIASFGSFVTLFLQPDSFFNTNTLKLFAQIEGFIGVFSISLFVYTLTRSIHR